MTVVRNRSRARPGSAVVALAIAVAFAAPIAVMILVSLKTQEAIFSDPLSLPLPPDIGAYGRAWDVGSFGIRARNSVVVTVASVALATVLGGGVGYACARLKQVWLAGPLFGLFALGVMVPVQTGVIPLFQLMQWLGLLGTLAPMILVSAALQLPLTVIVFTGFFRALPEEVEEAAMVDGAGRLRTLISVVVPLARPAVLTAIVLNVLAVWNDYFVALVFATEPDLATLPLGLTRFSSSFSTDWGGTLAYSTMIAVPVLLLYIVLQRYIVDGIATGAGK